MRIWHVGASSSPFRVDGVSRTVWSLSRQQARLGHDVTLVIDTPPEPAATQLARESGLKLIEVHATALSYRAEIRRIVEADKPQIVHMHSVFVVRQSAMAKVLQQMGVPYVITPHAGLAPQVLRRGVVKKTLYSWLRERPRFMGASAIGLVTPNEERSVRAFLPDYHKIIRWMPNPIDIDQFDPYVWNGLQQKDRRVVFMGRFDVLVKGIDVLIEIARLLPDTQFDLYGTEDNRTLDWLNRLRANLPANVTFHEPIFGLDKAKMLAGVSFYLQPSRWEGFPVSVAECLHMGVPCAIADTLDMAQLFYQHDIGLVIPLDPPRAAESLRAAMNDEQRLLEWSRRGKEFAHEHFHPAASARNHLELYQDVLESLAPATGTTSPQPAGGRSVAVVPANVRASVKKSFSVMMNRTRRLVGSESAPRTVVLCYHSVNRSPADLSVDPDVLRRQMMTLRDGGFEFTDFRGLIRMLMRSGASRKNLACITFDDGYEDNFTQAAPLLMDLGIPATIFVTTGLMSRDPTIMDRFHKLTKYETTYLSPRQVQELSRMGFEIGCHTHTHSNMARLTPEQTWDEISRSKEMVEEATGSAVRSFAYPFGKRGIHYTPATVSAVRESGLGGAAAVAFRAVNANTNVRIYEIPRFFVTRADSMESFAQKVRGDYDWLGAIQQNTPAWFKGMLSPEDRYL